MTEDQPGFIRRNIERILVVGLILALLSVGSLMAADRELPLSEVLHPWVSVATGLATALLVYREGIREGRKQRDQDRQ